MRHLFVELTLIAIILAAIRLIFVLGLGAYDERYAIVVLFTAPNKIGIAHSAIGGLFGDFATGTKWGCFGLAALMLLGLFYSGGH